MTFFRHAELDSASLTSFFPHGDVRIYLPGARTSRAIGNRQQGNRQQGNRQSEKDANTAQDMLLGGIILDKSIK